MRKMNSIFEDGTLCLLLFKPGWSLLDARAYSFQFLRIAASKALLPPGGTCLDVWHDHIEIPLVLSSTGIACCQDIKRVVVRAKLPHIGQHLLDIMRLHQLIRLLEWANSIPLCSPPKRLLHRPKPAIQIGMRGRWSGVGRKSASWSW